MAADVELQSLVVPAHRRQRGNRTLGHSLTRIAGSTAASPNPAFERTPICAVLLSRRSQFPDSVGSSVRARAFRIPQLLLYRANEMFQ